MLVERRGNSARTTGFVRPVLQTRVIDVCVLLGSGESTARKVSAIADGLLHDCK